LSSAAYAGDVISKFPINNALNNEKVKESLNNDVALYWGDQSHQAINKNFGSYKVSKRTNAFGKTKEYACQWALAAAVKTLQDRAVKEGGNAVIDIKSNIKNREESSATDFTCLVGTMMVNVALKGTVVELKK